MDDGADVVAMLHSDKRHLLGNVIGAMEETAGVIKIKALSNRKS